MGFLMFTSIELSLYAINSMIDFDKKKQMKYAAGLMFLVFFIFAGLRGSGDADYYNYLYFAKDIGTDLSKVFSAYPVEIGFRISSYLINALGISRQAIIILMNFLSIVPTAYVCLKESKNPFLSAIIFLPIFIQFDMQTSRTASAIGLGFLSIYLFSKNKKIKSFIALLLALSFHKSAVILLPFFVLMKIDLSKTFQIIAMGLSFLVSVFSKQVLMVVGQILSAIGMGTMSLKITNYTFQGTFAKEMSFIDPRILYALFLFLTSLIYFNKKEIKKMSIEDISIKAIWFCAIVLLVFRSSTAIAFRFSNFFGIFQMLYLPILLKKLRKEDEYVHFLVYLSIFVYIVPYAIFLMVNAPTYGFFFTNEQAILSLKN
ncbi:EpsG family protein [Anaerococcus hydrogenalis]|uniref:EpsG family protein n=1 Tax=Anaerococcus hydrogenalis TaxID=33029 RepID=UPI001D4A87C1|nr:EpsG family protein [Anaerococcus hydrogenalis]MBS5988124.1 EpsG family protein [Anaerococcus hydrogenalis]